MSFVVNPFIDYYVCLASILIFRLRKRNFKILAFTCCLSCIFTHVIGKHCGPVITLCYFMTVGFDK